MKVEKVKNRNFVFTYSVPDGWDLNLHLIKGSKNNYVIDTGLGSLSVKPILEHIRGDNKPVIVINTHYHWDHVWGNNSFPDSVIISHSLCREMIDSSWEKTMQRYKDLVRGEVKKLLPNITFENELNFPEDKVRIIYTPGHTIDSISVIDEEDRVLNAGDNIGDTVDDIVPNLDCEREIYIKTLKKYDSIDFDVCISGHNVILGSSVTKKIMSKLD
ncbi:MULTISPECIES: MBL fold metallo-hydrolase [unclassified Sedimentibacter]|uniref:MBL fold metallo-hydrolase n=1 Tax=unclassified Sedimentibacter TaxID=2649220 RepID=UPI0027DFF0FB|nr:MBL fold metallo-hydrolase [Sedimentibacter sp. MB35-C1]WMJ76074.1 MBL fold metallo-hydrolase [Sedimentibacter sp. MB35-C1]